MAEISYGDEVTLNNTTEVEGRGSTGLLGIYDKGVKYLVTGKGNDPKGHPKVGTDTTWQIMESTTASGTGAIKYGDPFVLKNVTQKLWVSDDKRSECFDGADGYFGLAKDTCANTYQFLGKSGTVNDGDSEIILVCASEKWNCVGKTLTLYAFNEAVYLVWDSPNYPAPKFTIKSA